MPLDEEESLTLAGSLLGLDGSLLTHRGENDDVGVLLLGLEKAGDLLANLTIRDLDVILGIAIIVHEGKETIVGDVKKLKLATVDVGDVHVVGRRAEFFQFLASEDIKGNEMDFGVTVLSGLGGRHVNDLAGTALDDDETVLSEGGALHRIGQRCTGIDRVERVLMLGVVSHGEGESEAK